jgi:hypothetical protein
VDTSGIQDVIFHHRLLSEQGVTHTTHLGRVEALNRKDSIATTMSLDYPMILFLIAYIWTSFNYCSAIRG